MLALWGLEENPFRGFRCRLWPDRRFSNTTAYFPSGEKVSMSQPACCFVFLENLSNAD